MARSVKPTILVISPVYDEPHRTVGSAPKICRQLSRFARVVVLCGGSSTRTERRSENLTVHFCKEWLWKDPVNNAIVPGLFRKARELLRKEKPAAVLNIKYMFYPNLLVPWLHQKGYRVVTVTDTFPGYTWFSTSKLVNAVMWLYTRTLGLWVLRSSDQVLLFHQGLAKTAKQLRLPYKVVPNGVEFDIVAKAKPKKLAGKVNILYVGRLESVKGYETIIAAMKQVANTDVHFYHLGHIGSKQAYVDTHRSPNMHFVGYKTVQEYLGYMKGADIIVLASKSEGLPNVLMEGMACGCVPVTTRTGAIPYVLEDGALGRFFSYGDVAGLVKQLNWLIRNPAACARMQAKGREKILREYNWETLAHEYKRALLN